MKLILLVRMKTSLLWQINSQKLPLNHDSKDSFLAADFGGMTVADKLIEQTGVIGEKLDLKAFEKVESPYVGAYVHINKIAAVVGLSANVENAAVLSKDLAMQVASMGATSLSYKDFDPALCCFRNRSAYCCHRKRQHVELARLGKTLKNVPKYISMAQLTPEVLAEAEEEAKAQLKAEGKPEQIWDKILPGKMDRFISDNTTLDKEQCLLDQNFIKDEKALLQNMLLPMVKLKLLDLKE